MTHPLRTSSTVLDRTQPVISVIVPIYKVEKLLRRCIESILAQTYPNIELILVDDGSPDKCPAMVDEYAAAYPGIIVPVHQHNQGLGPARNSGIKASTGDLLSFVDSDDYVEPHFLSTMYERMQRTRSDIVVCNFMFDFPGGIRMPFPLLTARRNLTGDQAGRKALDLLTIPTFAWNKLYKRELFTSYDIKFPSIYYEDVATIAKVLTLAERVAVTHQTLYHYCLRGGSITGTFTERNVYDYLRAAGMIRDFIWDAGLWPEWKHAYRRFIRNARIQIEVTVIGRAHIGLTRRNKLLMESHRQFDALRQPPSRPRKASNVAPLPEVVTDIDIDDVPII